jgi:hypothetical protein
MSESALKRSRWEVKNRRLKEKLKLLRGNRLKKRERNRFN